MPIGRSRAADALAAFAERREVMRAFRATTQEDLRGQLLRQSKMDVYQWLLMIRAAQRHVLQIREIRASAAFPAR